jgi:hypothetical protein
MSSPSLNRYEDARSPHARLTPGPTLCRERSNHPLSGMNVSTATLMPRFPPGYPQLSKATLFSRAKKAFQSRSLGVTSVLLTHHLDMHRAQGGAGHVPPCCPMQGFFKRELMSLRTEGYVRLRCPPIASARPAPSTTPTAGTATVEAWTTAFASGDQFSGRRPCTSCVPNAFGGDAIVVSPGRVQRPLFFPYKHVQCAFATSITLQGPVGAAWEDGRASVFPTELPGNASRTGFDLNLGALGSYAAVAAAAAHVPGFGPLRNDSELAVLQRREEEEGLCLGARTYKPPARRRKRR